MCEELAPSHFKLDSERLTGYLASYVFCQPETPEQIAACEKAVWACPHEAVRNDGNQGGDISN